MIKCMVVGGNTAIKLADFIRESSGGSIEIAKDNVYSSFQRDKSTLERSLIRVNKLIYLIDEISSIREDFKILDGLMENATFFNIEEIWIFGKDNEDNNKAMQSFKTIMADLDFDNYFIELAPDDVPFTKIYRNMIGRVDNDDESKVQYKKVYRAYRSEESKKGYDAKSFDKNLEPKIKNSAAEYEKMKEVSKKIETGRIIKEAPVEELEKIDIKIDTIDLQQTVYKKKIFIVSGRPKSGISALASSLCMSIGSNTKLFTNLIDISRNCGSARSCIRIGKKVTLVNNEKLLTGTDYSNKKLAIYNSSDIKSSDVKSSYLKYLLSIPNRVTSDIVVIDCDYSDLDDVVNICGARIGGIFICSQDVKDEVLLIQNEVNRLNDKGKSTLIFLNNSIKFDDSFEKISAVNVKKLCPGSKVIMPVDLTRPTQLWTLVESK